MKFCSGQKIVLQVFYISRSQLQDIVHRPLLQLCHDVLRLVRISGLKLFSEHLVLYLQLMNDESESLLSLIYYQAWDPGIYYLSISRRPYVMCVWLFVADLHVQV